MQTRFGHSEYNHVGLWGHHQEAPIAHADRRRLDGTFGQQRSLSLPAVILYVLEF